MRDTHGKKYSAQNQEYGYDRSEHEEWNTYAAEELEVDKYSYHTWNEKNEEDMK